MKRSRTETTEKKEQLNALEEHLADALKPITPPTELVARMRDRIRFPQREEIVSRIGDWQRLIVAFGVVMSSFLVAITVARALFYFVSRR
jgi:hypothetical protein